MIIYFIVYQVFARCTTLCFPQTNSLVQTTSHDSREFPSYNLSGVYWSGKGTRSIIEKRSERHDEMEHLTHMNLTTKIPSLNLDFVPGLLSLKCPDSETIEMEFENSTLPMAWNLGNGLIFMISPKWNCDEDDKTAFKWTNSSQIINDTFVFAVQSLKFASFVKEYDIHVSSSPEVKPSHTEVSNDFETCHITDTGKKRHFSFQKTGPLMEYKRQFAKQGDVEVYCDPECKVGGTLSYMTRIRGNSFLHLPRIETTAFVKYSAKVELRVRTNGPSSNMIDQSTKLFSTSFSSFSIPGLIEFGPELDIVLKKSFKAKSAISLNLGFNASIPGVTSILNLASDAQHENESIDCNAKPTFSKYLKSTNPNSGFEGEFGIYSKIQFVVRLFGKKEIYKTGIAMDGIFSASLGNQSPKFTQRKCEDPTQIPISFNMGIFVSSFVGPLSTYLTRPVDDNLSFNCVHNYSLANSFLFK